MTNEPVDTPIPEEEILCPTKETAAEEAPVEPVSQFSAEPEAVCEPVTQPPMTAAPKKKRKFRPNLGVRILLRLATWLVCLCLSVSFALTALVLDVRLLTSGDNLRSTVTAILSPKSAASRRPVTGAAGVAAAEESQPEIDPEELLSEMTSAESAGSLLDLLYAQMEEQYGEELAATKEQLQEFYDRSTVPEFLADKLASCIEDLLNGTDNTRITDEEISALINDNADLICAVFGVEVDDALRQKALDFSKEAGLEQLLREQLVGTISQLSLGEDGITVEQILAKLRELTSLTVLWTLIAIDLVLAALLYFTNWLRLGATLRSIGIPMLTVGCALSAPILLIDLLVTPSDTALYPIIHALYAPIIPVHYGMLIGGAVLLIAGIVVGIVSRAKAK